MQTTSTPGQRTASRVWVGHWLMAVAALHTLFALVVLHKPLLDIVQRGVFDTVGQNARTAAAVWFVLCGALLALLSLAITPLERTGDHTALRRQGWGLLALGVLGVILMPSSGFWLTLPAGIALTRKQGANVRI